MLKGARVVIIGGIKRSGSTWLYNVVRILLREQGYDVAVQGGIAALKEYKGRNDYLIVKTHFHSPRAEKVADMVLTSTRDLDGIRGSLTRFGRKPPTDEEMEKLQAHFEIWNSMADYCMDYQDLVDRPLEVVQDVVDCFGFEGVDAERILALVNDIKPPTDQRHDPETFYFANHITSEDVAASLSDAEDASTP